MTSYDFESTQPIAARIELRSGSVDVTATDTDTTSVEITGGQAEDAEVTFDGKQLRVIGPRATSVGFFNRSPALRVAIGLPTGSDVQAALGSADLTLVGRFGEVTAKSGSGDVSVEQARDALLKTGSGDVRCTAVEQELRAKTGSGDISVVRATDISLTTGSGGIRVESNDGVAVARTGSGDCEVLTNSGEFTYSTGSGAFVAREVSNGRISINGASGDVALGVANGTPVWTDIRTISGTINSDLEPLGAPAEGQPHLELHVKTASGDINLRHL